LQKRPAADTKSEHKSQICLNCGKSSPKGQKAGSFTAFMFKELRCHCEKPKYERANQRRQQAKTFKEQPSTAPNSSAVNPFVPGTIVGGTFKIKATIGEGGMGTVYLVQHLSMLKDYALKVLSPELVSEAFWRRFQAEAKTLAALKHPNLVSVYDLGIHEKHTFFYSMDYLQGTSLEEILAKQGSLDLLRTVEIFLSVLDGLAYAHRNGVIHRDIKPANIFICSQSADGVAVKILDFGIAKLINSDQQMQKLTAVGEIFGSPYYMSPEQCAGLETDARSDIYAVGCSMFETLTGSVPFDGTTSLQ